MTSGFATSHLILRHISSYEKQAIAKLIKGRDKSDEYSEIWRSLKRVISDENKLSYYLIVVKGRQRYLSLTSQNYSSFYPAIVYPEIKLK
jgi:hypothetical protein